MNNLLGRYELIDPDRNMKKFWEVLEEVSGVFVVRWGRIGTTGQSQTVDEHTAYKRATEKMAKGYELVEKQRGKVPLGSVAGRRIHKINKNKKKKENKDAQDWIKELKAL